jgi:lipid-A-disaccharide synthase
MSKTNLHFIIVAGEASGDMHAAHLVRAIKERCPQASFSGLGGPQMAAEGVDLLTDLTRWAVVGFVEVLKHYQKFKKIFHLLLAHIKDTRPDAVILVDYPGFNLRLAPEIKKLGIRVIYYISPQVWAWKEKRVETIRDHTDRLLVLFPFEKGFYARHHIDVTLVGHPLVDIVKTQEEPRDYLRDHGIPEGKTVIGLLPGSRLNEINNLLPAMLEAGHEIRAKTLSPVQFLLFKAPTIPLDLLEQHIRKQGLPVRILETNIYDGIQSCALCLVASGTATLETAILNTPMVIIYKTTFLTWLLAKLFIKIPCIGLVNIVAGKKIVPECVQQEANARTIAQEAMKILSDSEKRIHMKKELSRVKELLGDPGASGRAAEEVLRVVQDTAAR